MMVTAGALSAICTCTGASAPPIRRTATYRPVQRPESSPNPQAEASRRRAPLRRRMTARGPPSRIPGDLDFATKPQLAMRQPGRLTAAGLPVRWVAFDEVYGHSEELRKKAAKAGLSYVASIPCAYQVPLPSGAVIRADEAVPDAVSERRSCGNDADLLIPLGDAPVPVRGGQPALPARHRPHQAVDRRDRPARRSRPAVRRRADLPRPPLLRAALVRPATAAPGHRPLAPLQRPAPRHNRNRVTSRGRKGGDAM